MNAVDRAQIIAERDAQIIAWLGKKAAEYGTSNRENRAKAEAVGRMADKLSRGAVRDDETGVSELYRLRAENNQLRHDITGACLARWEEEQENDRLRAERHSTNEALDDAVREIAELRARVAELEAARRQGGMRPGERRLAERTFADLEATHWKRLGIDPPQQEAPHDSPLHHDYALGRDLPVIPHQTTGRCPQGHLFEDCTCGGGR